MNSSNPTDPYIPLDETPDGLPMGSEPTLHAPAVTPDVNAAGRIRMLGSHQIIREIARGGMGVVYEARHCNLNRTVAVKLLLAGNDASLETIRRFMLEAEAVSKLRHPHIIAIHELGNVGDQHYFSMDYIQGPSLARLVKDGPLTAMRAATYVTQIAEAIAHAHQNGILHRDLKPANILIDSSTDSPVVTDFGLAKRLGDESEMTATGMILGTPGYMSPEQANGEKLVGESADVYGLGATLYHLLTGKPPFQGETPFDTLRMVIEQEPVGPRLLNPKVPAALESICLKCLAKHPSKRYPSAKELASDLHRFLSGEPVQARPPSMTALLGAWYGRQWRFFGRAFVLGLLLSLPAIFLMGVESRVKIEHMDSPALSSKQIIYHVLLGEQRAITVYSHHWGPIVFWLAWAVPAVFLLCIGGVCAHHLKATTRDETLIVGSACGLAMLVLAICMLTLPRLEVRLADWASSTTKHRLTKAAELFQKNESGKITLSEDALNREEYEFLKLPAEQRWSAYITKQASRSAIGAQAQTQFLLLELLYASLLCLGAGVLSAYIPSYYREVKLLKGNASWLSTTPFDYWMYLYLVAPTYVFQMGYYLLRNPDREVSGYVEFTLFGFAGMLMLSLVILLEYTIRHTAAWADRRVSARPLVVIGILCLGLTVLANVFEWRIELVLGQTWIFFLVMLGHFILWRRYQRKITQDSGNIG